MRHFSPKVINNIISIIESLEYLALKPPNNYVATIIHKEPDVLLPVLPNRKLRFF